MQVEKVPLRKNTTKLTSLRFLKFVKRKHVKPVCHTSEISLYVFSTIIVSFTFF